MSVLLVSCHLSVLVSSHISFDITVSNETILSMRKRIIATVSLFTLDIVARRSSLGYYCFFKTKSETLSSKTNKQTKQANIYTASTQTSELSFFFNLLFMIIFQSECAYSTWHLTHFRDNYTNFDLFFTLLECIL